MATYFLISTKGTMEVNGKRSDAIKEAIKMEKRLRPVYGVGIELDELEIARVVNGKLITDW